MNDQIISGLLSQAAKPLPGVFHRFEGTLHTWGYLAVAGFIFFEDFGIPLPGETMLIAAALYAGAGHLNVFVVGLVAFVAAVAGDNVGYAIGRFGGRELVERYGKWVFLTGNRLDRAEKFFTKHGGKIVTIARFVEGLRQLNGIIAGTSSMPWRRFVVFNIIGAVLWVGTWSMIGYFAGDHIDVIYREITKYSLYVLIGLVVVGAAFIVRAWWRRRRSSR